MDITTGLVVIAIIYGVLLFFDRFFKTCAHYPYLKFLEGTGFQIGFFTIKWKTKAFNRMLIRWGNNRPHFQHLWFTCGIYASLVLLPVSIILLLYSISLNFLTPSTREQVVTSSNRVIIEPIIPGVNLPMSELGYYSLTLVLCSVIHELGHALAAVSEDVNLIETGVNVFFVLPVAYVNLSTEKFNMLNKKNVLKILCAGIWHNLVLTLFAYSLFHTLPFFFSPFYHVNKGVTIIEITKNSPLIGARGIDVGDIFFKINNCHVYNEKSWYNCIDDLRNRRQAFCIESSIVHNLDESVHLRHMENGNLDCCDGKNVENACFEYLEKSDGILELPSHVCLPSKLVVEKSMNFCQTEDRNCPEGSYCFRPILVNGSNFFKIVGKEKNVMYLGFAGDLYQTIEVSSYIPKIFFTSHLPDMITKLVKYVAVFSLGLAVLNVIPFMCMDGQYITDALGIILLKKIVGKNKTRMITLVINLFFTVTLLLHCLVSVSKVLL